MDPLGIPVPFEENFSGVEWAFVCMEVGAEAVEAIEVGVTEGAEAFKEPPKLPRGRLLITAEGAGVGDGLA
jgi:hypothetical protein